MAYFIYENWQAGPHKAVLHHGDCGFCNEGKGLAGGSDPHHGRWHGPFQALRQAEARQARMHVEVRKRCRCV